MRLFTTFKKQFRGKMVEVNLARSILKTVTFILKH